MNISGVKARGIVLLLLFLSACATPGTRRPDWIVNPPKDERYLYSVGVKTSAPSLEQGRRSAIQQAVGELVQYFGFTSQVKYNEVKTELTTKVLDEIRLSSEEVRIRGSVLEDWYFEKRGDGTYDVYVMVKYPREEVEKEKARQQREEAERLFIAQRELRQGNEAEVKGEILTAINSFISALKHSSDSPGGKVIAFKALDSLKGLIQGLHIEEVSGKGQ